jgi:hypothetical protein
MAETDCERIKALEMQVQHLTQMLVDTRGIIELLAAKHGFEYSQDCKNFVSKELLDSFKAESKAVSTKMKKDK